MGADGEFPIFASSSTFPSPARPFRLGTTDVPTFPPVPPLPPTVVAAATAACDTTATCAPRGIWPGSAVRYWPTHEGPIWCASRKLRFRPER